MTVAELIQLLKTFPPDVEVVAFDTTEEMKIVIKGGVVLEDDFYCVLASGQQNSEGILQLVTIVGGPYTHNGWIDGSDKAVAH